MPGGSGTLAEEEDLLQRSSFFKVKGGAPALRAVDEREDRDCPPDGLGDRDSLAARVLLDLVGHFRIQVHGEPHMRIRWSTPPRVQVLQASLATHNYLPLGSSACIPAAG